MARPPGGPVVEVSCPDGCRVRSVVPSIRSGKRSTGRRLIRTKQRLTTRCSAWAEAYVAR